MQGIEPAQHKADRQRQHAPGQENGARDNVVARAGERRTGFVVSRIERNALRRGKRYFAGSRQNRARIRVDVAGADARPCPSSSTVIA